jgi:hypothetical protein
MVEKQMAALRKHLKNIEKTKFSVIENKAGFVVKQGKHVVVPVPSKEAGEAIVIPFNKVLNDQKMMIGEYISAMEQKMEQLDCFKVMGVENGN